LVLSSIASGAKQKTPGAARRSGVISLNVIFRENEREDGHRGGYGELHRLSEDASV